MDDARQIILVNPQLQLRWGIIIGVLAVSVVIVAMATLALLPGLLDAFSQEREIAPKAIGDVLRTSWLVLIIGLSLIFSFAFLIGIFYSQRVAGPLSRIDRALLARLKSDSSEMIRLRRKDTLHELSDHLNSLFKKDDEIREAGYALLQALEKVVQENTKSLTVEESQVSNLHERMQRLRDTFGATSGS